MGLSLKSHLEDEDCLVIVVVEKSEEVVFGIYILKGDRCAAPIVGDTGP